MSMRVLGIFRFLIALLAVAAVAPAHADEWKPTWTPEDSKQVLILARQARSLFSDNLNDYSSARFRDSHGAWSSNKAGRHSYLICGKMNSKNGFGGYTGWQDFVVVQMQGQIALFTDPQSILDFCTEMTPITLVINNGIDFSPALRP